jgi:hypothetical protein
MRRKVTFAVVEGTGWAVPVSQTGADLSEVEKK